MNYWPKKCIILRSLLRDFEAFLCDNESGSFYKSTKEFQRMIGANCIEDSFNVLSIITRDIAPVTGALLWKWMQSIFTDVHENDWSKTMRMSNEPEDNNTWRSSVMKKKLIRWAEWTKNRKHSIGIVTTRIFLIASRHHCETFD